MLIRNADESASRFASHDRQLAMNPNWMKQVNWTVDFSMITKMLMGSIPQGVRSEQPTAPELGNFQDGRVPMKGVGADWTDMGF